MALTPIFDLHADVFMDLVRRAEARGDEDLVREDPLHDQPVDRAEEQEPEGVGHLPAVEDVGEDGEHADVEELAEQEGRDHRRGAGDADRIEALDVPDAPLREHHPEGAQEDERGGAFTEAQCAIVM